MSKPKLVSTYFRRYEQKYLLDQRQYDELSCFLPPLAKVDQYGKSTVSTIYYDTDDFYIVRKARNGDVFKEKLRLRAYGTPKPTDTVYLELKKKLKGITYKRRIPIALEHTGNYNSLGTISSGSTYVINEINCFLQRYKPTPKILISCNRIALQGVKNPSLRITFDTNLSWRTTDLDLARGNYGAPLLGDDQHLMELKVDEAVPLELSCMLAKLRVFPVSFSKYSKAYETMMLNLLQKKENLKDDR